MKVAKQVTRNLGMVLLQAIHMLFPIPKAPSFGPIAWLVNLEFLYRICLFSIMNFFPTPHRSLHKTLLLFILSTVLLVLYVEFNVITGFETAHALILIKKDCPLKTQLPQSLLWARWGGIFAFHHGSFSYPINIHNELNSPNIAKKMTKSTRSGNNQ